MHDLNTKCQLTINRLFDWLLANRLSINYVKTSYMLFSPSRSMRSSFDLTLSLNNNKISRVTTAKFLGITIDENLDWTPHINDLCLMLRKYVGVFYKLSFKLPQNILRMLYFAIVYPHLLYGIELYANTFETYLHDLVTLNNRILRILQHKPIHTTLPSLYYTYCTLPINKLFQFQLLLHTHNIYYNSDKLPSIFLVDRILNHSIHSHNTRTSLDFHRTLPNSNIGSKVTSTLGARLWNSLPLTLKSINGFNQFKNKLKEFLYVNEI